MTQDLLWEIGWVLGLDTDRLTLWQMVLRAVIVYGTTLLMVRLGEKRFLGKNTPFDVILGIILGSVVSRAINGSAPLFPTLAAGVALVSLHWLLSFISFRSNRFGDLIKGNSRVLVRDGQIDWTAMRQSNISHDDLLGALRSGARTESVEGIETARLERSGHISAIKAPGAPQVVEITVAEGVQTVRIQIEPS